MQIKIGNTLRRAKGIRIWKWLGIDDMREKFSKLEWHYVTERVCVCVRLCVAIGGAGCWFAIAPTVLTPSDTVLNQMNRNHRLDQSIEIVPRQNIEKHIFTVRLCRFFCSNERRCSRSKNVPTKSSRCLAYSPFAHFYLTSIPLNTVQSEMWIDKLFGCAFATQIVCTAVIM